MYNFDNFDLNIIDHIPFNLSALSILSILDREISVQIKIDRCLIVVRSNTIILSKHLMLMSDDDCELLNC